MTNKIWTAEDVTWLMQIAQPCESLNRVVSVADESGDIEVGELLEDTAPSPDEIIIAEDRKRILNKYINKYLDPREAKVILMRYGFETGTPMTLEDVGNHFGVTRERIRQVEMRALNKLRRRFSINNIRKEDL